MHRLITIPLVSLALASPAAGGSTVTAPPGQTRWVAFTEAVEVQTAVLRATAVVLGNDERLRGLTLADSERWQVELAEFGPEDSGRPVLTITPTDCGITTSLLALTTRRLYPLTLTSAPCDLRGGSFDPRLPFDAVVRYRYPDSERTTTIPPPPPKPAPPGVRFGMPLEELLDRAGHYSVRAKKGYRGPRPTLITDDGTRTYLVFPEGAFGAGAELPLFFRLDPKGKRELTNFTVVGSTFIVPGLLDRAVLLGAGKGKRTPHLLVTRRK